MFAEFDYSFYETNSIVKVKLNKKIKNKEDFYNFLSNWINLYEKKRDFIFIFDTYDVGYIPIKYSIQMSLFIKQLKKKPFQYLQKSIILVNSNIVKHMLDFIFFLQPPVAPVYIINNEDYIDVIINDNIIDNDNDNDIIVIKPSRSFLYIL
tara:strand:+ start:2551 stop:3003 length:453 start_codon:yes stop_codon:yes gene_type:complete